MKKGEFPDLIKEENDEQLTSAIVNKVKNLIPSKDIECLASNLLGKLGSLMFMS